MRAWLLVACACGPQSTLVVIEEPATPPGAGTAIFAFSQHLFVVDLDDRTEPLLQFSRETEDAVGTVDAFFYRRDPGFYGIGPGALTPAQDDGRACVLSRPFAVSRYGSGAWEPASLAQVAESLSRVVDPSLGCTTISLCRSFRRQDLESEDGNDLSQVPLDDETALVASKTRKFYRVTQERIEPLRGLEGLPAGAGAVRDDGEIWLVGFGSEWARGTLEGGFEVETIEPAGPRFNAIASRGDTALMVGGEDMGEGTTATVSIYRYSAGLWSRIHEERRNSWDWDLTSVVWFGDTAIITFGGSTLFRVRGTEVVDLRLDLVLGDLSPLVNSVAVVEGFGAVAGTGGGRLLVSEDPDLLQWKGVEGQALGNSVTGIGGLFEGIMYGGPDGFTNQFYPDAESCDSQLLAAADVEEIRQYGDAILISGGNPNRRENARVTWLTESLIE